MLTFIWSSLDFGDFCGVRNYKLLNLRSPRLQKRLKTAGLNRIDLQNNIGLNGGSVGVNGYLVTATRQCYSLGETRANNSLRVTTFASDYLRE